ncbi:MAG: arylamine N-acetyltransferase [Steroidobacteraceae bacterium]
MKPPATIDLPAYFERIGYSGPRHASAAVLASIARLHAQSIAFENIDAFLGRRISLALPDVQRKLVAGRRGGWCFEQNLLLGDALRELGFGVTDLAARVMWNRPPEMIGARTHRLLRVHCEGTDWIVDAGFGGQTLTGALALHSEAAQATPHEPFRLRALASGEQVMESLIRDEWKPLFRFDLQPQHPVDFEAANFQLVHDPASHFAQTLIVSRATEAGRWVLKAHELGFYGKDGRMQRQMLPDEDAILAALGEQMCINVEGLPELRERLGWLLRQAGEAGGALADL